jgi:hypothetical protein
VFGATVTVLLAYPSQLVVYEDAIAFSYAAIFVQSGVCVVLISEKPEVWEVSITLQTSALLAVPSAETPSTLNAKFT